MFQRVQSDRSPVFVGVGGEHGDRVTVTPRGQDNWPAQHHAAPHLGGSVHHHLDEVFAAAATFTATETASIKRSLVVQVVCLKLPGICSGILQSFCGCSQHEYALRYLNPPVLRYQSLQGWAGWTQIPQQREATPQSLRFLVLQVRDSPALSWIPSSLSKSCLCSPSHLSCCPALQLYKQTPDVDRHRLKEEHRAELSPVVTSVTQAR